MQLVVKVLAPFEIVFMLKALLGFTISAVFVCIDIMW